MTSSLALRLLSVSRASGKPLPRFSEDDVIDFQVTEAIVNRAADEAASAEKKRKREDWKHAPVGSGPPPIVE